MAAFYEKEGKEIMNIGYKRLMLNASSQRLCQLLDEGKMAEAQSEKDFCFKLAQLEIGQSLIFHEGYVIGNRRITRCPDNKVSVEIFGYVDREANEPSWYWSHTTWWENA